jgi:putative lipoprotein (rSAM/lipoprotein system)
MSQHRLLRRISLLLGSALGATGCPVPEYGMPHASFDLSGTAVDGTTDAPIPGIEVDFDGNTATTGADGAWSLQVETAFACGPDCTLSAQDVDGEDNGTYDPAEQPFTATQTAEGDGDWDEGAWEAHDIEVRMTPAQDSGL